MKKTDLKSLLVVQFLTHLLSMRGLNVTDVRRKRIPLLWRTVRLRNSVGQRVSVLTMEIRSIDVSAEEQSCLEGVHTLKRSEKIGR